MLRSVFNHIVDRCSGHGIAAALTVLYCLIAFPSSATLHAQHLQWQFDSIETTVGAQRQYTFNPQVSFDRWGHKHYGWVTQDPNSSGLQVMYTNDITGTRGAPFLVNDTGTVIDAVNSDSTSAIFRLDRQSNTHVAFLANVRGPLGLRVGLYYTNNVANGFLDANPTLLTNEGTRYGMAVDSAGIAHIVWIQPPADIAPLPDYLELRYWNTTMGTNSGLLLDTLQCGGNCRTGDPMVESFNNEIQVFTRFANGTIYRVRAQNGVSTGIDQIPGPMPSPWMVLSGRSDTRLASAIDNRGAFHLLIPFQQRADSGRRLLLATNALGGIELSNVAEFDKGIPILDFDITSDGANRLAAVWTTYRNQFPIDRPKTGFVEYRQGLPGEWSEAAPPTEDLNSLTGNPKLEHRIAHSVAIRGDEVRITGLVYQDAGEYRTGEFIRRSIAPDVAYMIPDAAAPGMSVVVEMLAPAWEYGAFGPDTLNPSSVAVEFVDPADADRLVIGPSVVSWDGRLVSTMLFVRHDASVGEVPLRLRVGTTYSEPQSFSIVVPQNIGDDETGHLSGGGVLGSGGKYGRRSPRGVLVVDSLILDDGLYTIDMSDPDPNTPGNQGLLPVTILSRGPVRIGENARLSVSAVEPIIGLNTKYGIAGPGGGGGGAGTQEGGGPGFTAGGAPGESIRGSLVDGARPGSGGEISGRYAAGGSLTGVSGGTARRQVPGGGGTGHPFGTSGRHGRDGMNSPMSRQFEGSIADSGGYGGGTGGDLRIRGFEAFSNGGGGGSNATAGEEGESIGNGGRVIGNRALVPLAGGGGGGGAYSNDGEAAGGGGGGALSLISYREIQLFGSIEADGGNGVTEQRPGASGGGGGAGGGVLIGAQGGLILGSDASISALGGTGGSEQQVGSSHYSNGGDGGVGRVRIDGRIDLIKPAVSLDSPQPEFLGPSTGMSGSFQASPGTVIGGHGNPGDRLRIYVRPENGTWSYATPRDVIVSDTSEWSIELTESETADSLLYVTVLKYQEDFSSNRWTAVPRWVMSSAGGNIIGLPSSQVIDTTLDFGCVQTGIEKTITLRIRNTGVQSDLQIFGAVFVEDKEAFKVPLSGGLNTSSVRIGPGDSAEVVFGFEPDRIGSFSTTVRLVTNLSQPIIVRLKGCGLSGQLESDNTILDIGDLCPGTCVDTVLTVRNSGEAPLLIEDVFSADEGALQISVQNPTLPIAIEPGGERKIRLSICLRGSGEFGMSFKTNTVYPSLSIEIRANNIGPQPQLPLEVSFGTRDIGKSDTCPVLNIPLRNRSETLPLRIDDLSIFGTDYELLAPSPGTEIPPSGSVNLRVRFCTDEPGVHRDTLGLRLSTNGCALDTLCALVGTVSESLPELQLEITDKVDFGSVLVRTATIERNIALRNRGEGTAFGISYEIVSASPADAGGDIVINPGATPFNLNGGKLQNFEVSMIPAELGLRSVDVRFFTADGSWSRTVTFCVTGVEPGIVPDSLEIFVGCARVGGTVTREIKLKNIGTLSDAIVALSLQDSTLFTVSDLSESLPSTLRPGMDEFRITVAFKPTAIGDAEDVLEVRTSKGSVIMIRLTGCGLFERGEVDPNQLRFTCEDTVRTFTITNRGTAPLYIDRFDIPMAGQGAFRVLTTPNSDVIQPTESKSYDIEFYGRAIDSRTILNVQHSGSNTISVELIGESCEAEGTLLTFRMPDLEGHLEETIPVPLLLEITRPVEQEIAFDLLVEYEWSLLAPVSVLEEAEKPTTGADGVTIKEIEPGTLQVKGTIPEGATSGELLSIPMRVMLGRTYRTELVVYPRTQLTLPPGYRAVFDTGSFFGIDCDTTGTIDIQGEYSLKQNTPNPYKQSTVIEFEIARRGHVTIVLYDASGNRVATLLDEMLDVGRHQLVLGPEVAPAGRYFYEIVSGRYRATRSMLIVE